MPYHAIIGIGLAFGGLGIVISCVFFANLARRKVKEEKTLRELLAGLLPWNHVGLFVSSIGIGLALVAYIL